MTIDSTIRPETTDRGVQDMQHSALEQHLSLAPEPQLEGEQPSFDRQQQQLQAQAQGIKCPSCGTVNDPEAMFCASCGRPLRMAICPNCGSEIDPEADFCEVCHHYIKNDTCSFCGAHMSEMEIYCHERGNPRGGLVCPVDTSLDNLAICKQCGTPLTEEAKSLVEDLKKLPDYQFSEKCYMYLDMMKDLCKEKGVEFVLVKAPSLYPYWYEEYDEQMKVYAEKNGLRYYNLTERIDEIGLDFQKDTYDAGIHLNLSGARKLSSYFAELLSQEFELTDYRTVDEVNKRYIEKIDEYEKIIKENEEAMEK